jgi:hypothetical protein
MKSICLPLSACADARKGLEALFLILIEKKNVSLSVHLTHTFIVVLLPIFFPVRLYVDLM